MELFISDLDQGTEKDQSELRLYQWEDWRFKSNPKKIQETGLSIW